MPHGEWLKHGVAIELVLSRREDGGWGLDETETALMAAFAVLGMGLDVMCSERAFHSSEPFQMNQSL